MKPIPFEVTVADNPGVQAGGHWHPLNCTARQRLALIIPYRNRSDHLKSLLYRLHPLLQRQHIDYTIYVVEQVIMCHYCGFLAQTNYMKSNRALAECEKICLNPFLPMSN